VPLLEAQDVTVRFGGKAALNRTSIAVETERPVDGLTTLPGIHDPHVGGLHARFDVDTARLDGALKYITGLGVRSLTSQPPTLEELFLRHYGDELAELEGRVAVAPDGSSDDGGVVG